VWTTLGSLTAEVDTYYDSSGYGFPETVNEYDWGPTLARQTGTSYNFNTSCGVTNLTVIGLPCGVTVYNGSGTQVASTSYGYDANGNLLSSSSDGLTLNYTHNANGTLATSKDAAGNKTTYGYGSNSCNAFPDTVTPAITSLATTAVWNCNGAVMTSSTDANSQPTTFGYDLMNRLTSTGYPDTGAVTLTYTPSQVQTSAKLASGGYHVTTQLLDGLGRIVHNQDNSAGTEVDTGYNSLGQVASVSNPHFISGSSPSDGTTTYSYDALGRPADAGSAHAVTNPDSTYTSISYSSNCATVIDPAGKKRVTCTDGLGRTSSVNEDPAGLNYSTSYTYDALNNLLSVTQGSGQTPCTSGSTSVSRSYTYDALSRVASVCTPESGTTNYYYTNSSGGLCSGNPSAVCQRADARGTTTYYAYDVLNRLTGKTYSDSTPTANFFYDHAPTSWPAWSGVSFSNAAGRLTIACTGSAAGTCTSPQTAVAYSYDVMGRPLSGWQCGPATCGSGPDPVYATYDIRGNLTTLWNSQTIYWTSYDSADRLYIYDGDYPDPPGTPRPPGATTAVLEVQQWGPVGYLQSWSNAANGTTETHTYNNRTWLASISVATSSATPYTLGVTYYGNGNANTATDSINGNWTYTYDGVNRLKTAAGNSQSFTYNYDAFGNMTCTNTGNLPCTPLGLSFNTATNRISTSGYTYDAAGNLLTDNTHGYVYDAENRLTCVKGTDGTCTSSTATNYVYNALGQRVEKVQGTAAQVYTYDFQGQVFNVHDGSGNLLRSEFYTMGRHVGVFNPSLDALNSYGDWLGTERVRIVYGTGATEQCTDTPFGMNLGCSSTDLSVYHFAAMEYDGESNQYHTQFRQYEPPPGRWTSPDPLAGNVTNPQSLNRYAYALNNPTSMTDPTGLDSNECFWYYCGPPDQQFGASYDINYDPNSWKLANNIPCMAREYGCAGTPSEIDAGQQNYISDNCIGCVWVHGTMNGQSISKVFQSFAAWADYATSFESNFEAEFNWISRLVKWNNSSGLPDAVIIAIIWKESGFNLLAYNPAGGGFGAIGLMQVRQVGLYDFNETWATSFPVMTYGKSDLWDPTLNVYIGSALVYNDVFRYNNGDINAGLNMYRGAPGYAQSILSVAGQIPTLGAGALK
jgi:RHS repeat-associated protein